MNLELYNNHFQNMFLHQNISFPIMLIKYMCLYLILCSFLYKIHIDFLCMEICICILNLLRKCNLRLNYSHIFLNKIKNFRMKLNYLLLFDYFRNCCLCCNNCCKIICNNFWVKIHFRCLC